MLLEDFPLEIKVMIMSNIPDIGTLHNITHASPEFHSAYREARQEIFHQITFTNLGKIGIGMLDPWSATHVPHINLDSPDRGRFISEVLERYSERLPKDLDHRRLELDESIAILNLQRKFADIIEDYCQQKLSHSPLSGEEQEEPWPPSRSELLRLYRALYRYELYSRLFGADTGGTNTSVYDLYNTFNENDMAHLFFGLFPINEVEEIACLHKFASDHYGSKKVSMEMASLGPTYLHRMMKASTEPEWLTLLTEFPVNLTSMRCVLDAFERIIEPGEWHWKGMERKSSEERIPTTGWVWASKRGVQTLGFRRRWGYVFWDEERLVNWNVNVETMSNFPWPQRTRFHYF